MREDDIIMLGILAATDVTSGLLSLIIPGIISVLIVVLTNRNSRKERKDASNSDLYRVELESLNRQREAASAENEKLREALREELDHCRELRQHMDAAIEELKIKVNTIEAELFGWRNGLRTPSGYVLVRIPEDVATALNPKLNENPSGEK